MKIDPIARFSDSHNSMGGKKWNMKIDKLTLLHEFPYEWRDDLYAYLKQFIAQIHEFPEYGITRSFSPGCGGYSLSFEGRVPKSTAPLIWSEKAAYFLQVKPKNEKLGHFIRLDINPLGLTPAGMAHLTNVLLAPLGTPLPPFRFARVSHLDIAVDLYGVKLTDWIWDVLY